MVADIFTDQRKVGILRGPILESPVCISRRTLRALLEWTLGVPPEYNLKYYF
jgi:hypothetical protein